MGNPDFAVSDHNYRFVTRYNGCRDMARFFLDRAWGPGVCHDQIWIAVF